VEEEVLMRRNSVLYYQSRFNTLFPRVGVSEEGKWREKGRERGERETEVLLAVETGRKREEKRGGREGW
jgi:hypothetical protein